MPHTNWFDCNLEWVNFYETSSSSGSWSDFTHMFSPKQLFPSSLLHCQHDHKMFHSCVRREKSKRRKYRGGVSLGYLSLMENMGIGGVGPEEKQTETRARDTEIIFIWCTTTEKCILATRKKFVSNNLLMWLKCILHWLNIYKELNTIMVLLRNKFQFN